MDTIKLTEKQCLLNYIASNKTKQVFDILLNRIPAYLHSEIMDKHEIQNFYEQIILLSGKYQGICNEKQIGMLDANSINIEITKINHSLLSIVKHLSIGFFQFVARENQKELVKSNLYEQRQKIIKQNEAIDIENDKKARDILNITDNTQSIEIANSYNKLKKDYKLAFENAPDSLKKIYTEELKKLEDAFNLLYVKQKEIEIEKRKSAYSVMNLKDGCNSKEVFLNYKKVLVVYENASKSDIIGVRAAAVNELIKLKEAFKFLYFNILYDEINDASINQSEKYEKMVFVKGGDFRMECSDNYRTRNIRHKIEIDSFYIDQYQVSVAEYKQFCKTMGREMPSVPNWGFIDSHPIVNVSWQDSYDYAKWKNKRLPTEAEWEYAAKGGIKSLGFTYSGNNDANVVAWYLDNSENKTQPIGTKMPNELGIYDMSGNVWEWCSDWFNKDHYNDEPQNDAKGSDSTNLKILRGGSWSNYLKSIRIVSGDNDAPTNKLKINGFRCAKDV